MPSPTIDAAIDGDLEGVLPLVVALAWQASAVALAHYRPGIAVSSKNGDPTNMVTQADRDTNALIVQALRTRFPDDAVMAEESEASHNAKARQHARRLWCVDPIDGTREFVERSGDFAVMIGLAIDGTARLGVVLQPTAHIVYAGFVDARGTGHAYRASKDGATTPLHVRAQTPRANARLMVSRRHTSHNLNLIAGAVGVQTLVPMGSVGLKMAQLARGQAELYVSLSRQTHEWDACAPEAILKAAGGRVTDLDGAAIRYNKAQTALDNGIVASNGTLHDACIAAVRTVRAQRAMR